MLKEKIIREMKEVFKEIPFGVHHTLKVLRNAEDIMKCENSFIHTMNDELQK